MNIVLTGLRGTGKTSIGKALACMMGWDFIDIDSEIEKKIGMRLSEFVLKNGWDAFRKIEKKAARAAAEKDKTVISSGGGTLMDSESAAALKQNGKIVFLKADLAVLARRIEAQGMRPSLTGNATAHRELAEIWEQRREIYEKTADVTFDVSEETADSGKDAQNKASQILKLIGEN